VRLRIWIARLLVLVVFLTNVSCALVFIFSPENYAGAYELAGASGLAAIQGIGVVFLMWNATYPLVIVRPDRYRALFVVVLVQQLIGIIGESFILLALPEGHQVLADSILRFIAFDAVGLVLLSIGFFLSKTLKKPSKKSLMIRNKQPVQEKSQACGNILFK